MYNYIVMRTGVFFNENYYTDGGSKIGYIKTKLTDAGISCKNVSAAGELDGLDILIVLGGDGTILNLASECARRGIKIIGINYGHVGFLAEFEPEKLDEAVKLVCEGNYSTQSRSMLEIICGENKFLALNELVIQRNTSGNNFSNTVNLSAKINGATVDNFSSDGIIVSTPTGSTAYSLSAGGSVLTPDINAFILTPICAHSLHSRPIVFSDESVLEIEPLKTRESLVMIVDGRLMGTVSKGERLTVKKSQYTVEFIVKKEENFFNKLFLKLNKWSR